MKSPQTSENGHRNLNRMDFLRLLILGGGTALLSACQKVLSLSSPTPSTTLNQTATGTSIPTSTATATPTHTPTSTLTTTPTITATATTTETPTPTERTVTFFYQTPTNIIIDRQRNWQTQGWTGKHSDGGTVELIEDSNRGKVLKYTVLEDRGDGTVRSQLDKYGDPIYGPFEISMSFLLGQDYRPKRGGGANIISIFNGDRFTDRDFSLLALINLAPDGNLYLSTYDPVEVIEYQSRSNTKIPYNKWCDLSLICEGREISLKCNGTEIITTGIRDKVRDGYLRVVGIHGGAYGSGLPKDKFILNGPISIKAWQ